MVKRVRTTAWSRLLARNLKAMVRGTLKQVKAAATGRAKTSAKAGVKAVLKAATKLPAKARAKAARPSPAAAVRAAAQAAALALVTPPAPRARRRSPARPAAVPVARAPVKAPGAAAPRTAVLTAGGGQWLTGSAAQALAGSRHYGLYLPPAAGRATPAVPLLVMLHGCGQDAAGFAASTRMNRVAASAAFAVLYPEQDRQANRQGCWNWFDTSTGRAQAEAALLMAMIDQVCRRHRLDRSRVAVAGLSAGASMAALLATRYPERFKAVVMHSGVPPGSARSGLSALAAMRGHRPLHRAAGRAMATSAGGGPQRWPPLLAIHGDADGVVAASNAQDAVALWAGTADVSVSPPRTLQRGQRYPMQVTDHRQHGQLVAQQVSIAGLGHAWSGGASRWPFGDPAGPDASRLLWRFVAAHLG